MLSWAWETYSSLLEFAQDIGENTACLIFYRVKQAIIGENSSPTT